MEYKVGTAEILNPEIYKQVGAVLSFGRGVVGIDTKCMRTGMGEFREHGCANMIRFDPVDGEKRFDENHTIMGMQSVLYQKGVVASIVINGIAVPYVVSDSGPKKDVDLMQFIQNLSRLKINTQNIKGMRFHDEKVYLFEEEDLNKDKEGDLMYKLRNPKKTLMHRSLSRKIPGVYLVLGEYRKHKFKPSKNIPLRYQLGPGDTGEFSAEEVFDEGEEPDFDLDALVKSGMNNTFSDEEFEKLEQQKRASLGIQESSTVSCAEIINS